MNSLTVVVVDRVWIMRFFKVVEQDNEQDVFYGRETGGIISLTFRVEDDTG